jgi:molybdate transport system ATP-binding protein
MIEVRIATRLSATFALDVAFGGDGGITALYGRSGAGKTSVVRAIAGVLRPERGRIAIGGHVFLDTACGIDLPIERRGVGYVVQDSRLFPHVRVRDNLLYGFRRTRGPRPIGLDTVVDLLGIGHLLDRRPHHLSGGERQRVAIGRALLAHPRLLLLDEPLSSLDPPRKSELIPYIERLRDEFRIPMVYISHDWSEIVRLADHLVVLDGGRVAGAGPLVDVAADPALAPLIGRFEAGAVLDCRVAGHDPAPGTTRLTFAGGELEVPQIALAVGAPVRVRIRARDVAIALSEPRDVSISNRLAGIVRDVTAREEPYVDVGLDVGGTRLRALLTRASVARLGVRPGLAVWALVKSVALDGRSVGALRRPRE